MFAGSSRVSMSCLTLALITVILVRGQREFCERPDELAENAEERCYESPSSRDRYILYDVNPPEGFNLRRDVYVRVAVFLKNLIQQEKKFRWHLVLPPWGDMYHWRSNNAGVQTRLPWGMFFDIDSLQKYIPVMEMYTFLEEYPRTGEETRLDRVFILQNDDEMFKTGKFQDKNELVKCKNKSLQYEKLGFERYAGYFWGYRNVTARYIDCVMFHGSMSALKVNLEPFNYRSVMFDHMEIPLHDFYGSREYWQARRSMRYNFELYRIARMYRRKYLNSTDEEDGIERPENWTDENDKRRAVIGGPYLAVHMRRQDFLTSRSGSVPTIKSAALQIKNALHVCGLYLVFVATDAEEHEFDQLKKHLSGYTVLKFKPSNDILVKHKDGGVAIVDQIICSHARYFIGTYESTFTFRIQEDREIIGFPSDMTFNRLCKSTTKCEWTGRWEIIW